jgi:hypothetical protein
MALSFSRKFVVFTVPRPAKERKFVKKKSHRTGNTWYIVRKDLLADDVGNGSITSAAQSVEDVLLQPWHISRPC